MNLNKPKENSYEMKKINFTNSIKKVYKASYEKNKYALYYADANEIKIDVFNKKGKKIKQLYKFTNQKVIPNSKIELKNSKIYWITAKRNNKAFNNYSLNIYDLKNNKIETIEDIYDFYITDKKIYGLGYYNGNKRYARLYEIYNYTE